MKRLVNVNVAGEFTYKYPSNLTLPDSNFDKRVSPEQIKENKVIEGTDLGIFLYLLGWIIVGIVFTFTTNTTIQHILNFYLYYDIIALCFIVVHFGYNHKRHSSSNYKFLSFEYFGSEDLVRGLAYVGACFVVLIVVNFVLGFLFTLAQISFINVYNTNTHVLLSVSRTILAEELVFRGLILTCVVIFCREILRLKESILKIIAIVISGVAFGLLHYFRYVKPLADSQGFSLSLFQPIFYLSILGLLCGYLAIKEGLWAAILLHVFNNLVAIYGGNLSNFGIIFSLDTIIVLIFFLLIIVITYLIITRMKDDLFYFHYFAVSTVLFFVIGFYTNELISSENFGGLYFEHFHAILFVPFIYLLFRNRYRQGKVYSFLFGVCFGLFISDYLDIISLNNYQIGFTVLYLIYFFIAFLFTYILITKKFGRGMSLEND